MNFIESQADMNSSYIGGATGVFASGLVWLVAGIIGTVVSEVASVYSLFIGGMFIFPLSVLFSKLLSASGKHSSENVLRHLALESLPVLFGGLLVALYVAQFRIELFFPVMLLTIGARYFAFQTMYSLKEYWILGGALMVAGIVSTIFRLPVIVGAFLGGFLEVVFALIILKKVRLFIRK